MMWADDGDRKTGSVHGSNGSGSRSAKKRLTPLERRALADLAFQTECSLADPLACCERCWNRWVRQRTMEHLLGDCYWKELDRGDFALLRGPFHPNRALTAEVVSAIAAGSENLSVITWAFDAQKPLDDVLAILAALDVNARRLPRFAWLLRTARCARSAKPGVET